MKKIILNQFAGLGDILFTIPIARHFLKNGYDEVLYPTIFPNLEKHFPDIKFIDKNKLKINYERTDIYNHEDYIVYPLRFANDIMRVNYRNCMLCKYRYFNLPMKMWRDLTWVRDKESEDKIFYKHLGLKDGEKYNLINNMHRSDFKGVNRKIKVENGLKNVYVSNIQPFTLLDWSKVIERAATISVVSSSILLLLEILDLSSENVNLYIRRPEESDHANYSYICTKEYKFMEN